MKMILALALLALAGCTTAPADEQVGPDVPIDQGGAIAVVTELYDLVTFDAGTTPDWDAVRALFDEGAVIVLRTSRDDFTVFTLAGFVDDFRTFIERSKVTETGFRERILDLRATGYGDMAQVLVHFDSHIPGSDRAPHEGLDSFELIRTGDRWRIVSIVNERPLDGRTIQGGLPAFTEAPGHDVPAAAGGSR